MNYISLFSGIGGFELAIDRVLKATCDGYSEIDKRSISIYKRHYAHKALGPVEDIKIHDGSVDLLVAGFPCTDLSGANTNGAGLDGKRSGLFYEALRVLNLVRPKYFVFENVESMKEHEKDTISGALGVYPVMLDAACVSCQSRKRLFWANFKIDLLPEWNNDRLQACLLPVDDHRIDDLIHSQAALDFMSREVRPGITHWDFGHHFDIKKPKCACIVANISKGQPSNVLIDRRFGKEGLIRKLHPIEVERIMGFPDNYTLLDNLYNAVPDVHRYKALGNSVSIPVIEHIMQCLRRLA